MSPGTPTAPDTVVVRPRKTMIVAWIGAVAVFALFVVVAVLLRTADTGVYFRLADQVAMVVIGALIAGGVLLLARPRVRADAEGIEVRNMLVTRTPALGRGGAGGVPRRRLVGPPGADRRRLPAGAGHPGRGRAAGGGRHPPGAGPARRRGHAVTRARARSIVIVRRAQGSETGTRCASATSCSATGW